MSQASTTSVTPSSRARRATPIATSPAPQATSSRLNPAPWCRRQRLASGAQTAGTVADTTLIRSRPRSASRCSWGSMSGSSIHSASRRRTDRELDTSSSDLKRSNNQATGTRVRCARSCGSAGRRGSVLTRGERGSRGSTSYAHVYADLRYYRNVATVGAAVNGRSPATRADFLNKRPVADLDRRFSRVGLAFAIAVDVQDDVQPRRCSSRGVAGTKGSLS